MHAGLRRFWGTRALDLPHGRQYVKISFCTIPHVGFMIPWAFLVDILGNDDVETWADEEDVREVDVLHDYSYACGGICHASVRAMCVGHGHGGVKCDRVRLVVYTWHREFYFWIMFPYLSVFRARLYI